MIELQRNRTVLGHSVGCETDLQTYGALIQRLRRFHSTLKTKREFVRELRPAVLNRPGSVTPSCAQVQITPIRALLLSFHTILPNSDRPMSLFHALARAAINSASAR